MNRRTLTAALSTPELANQARQFVKGSPGTQPMEPPPVAPPAPASRLSLGLPVPAEIPIKPGLVAVTVRVPHDVPHRLLLASVDRRLKRQRPCTQQEIVAEALEQWLRTHGYDS